MTTTGAALEVRGMTKRFGDFVANDSIDLDLARGEVLGILGENGAGKSTLMNVLYGLLEADGGTISVNGERVDVTSPSVALSHGIGMVHQHFMLIPAFTVMENVVLGAETMRGGLLDKAAARAAVREVSSRFGLDVDPDALVSTLGVAARQRVEILRALYRGAQILILDEPTAALSPIESDGLFAMLRTMVAAGLSVILISHKLRELLSDTHRIAVFRDGRVVATLATKDATAGQLASLMVGREAKLDIDVTHSPSVGGVRLRASDIVDDRRRLAPVTMELRAGEIVGLAGVDGSGQHELTEVLAGIRSIRSGSLHIDDQDVTRFAAARRLAAGVAFVPDDRVDEGLVLDLPVYENAILRRQRRPELKRFGLLSPTKARAVAREVVEASDVRPRNVESVARNLSGGNQQKLMMGRELAEGAGVLIVSQPSRGVDISATSAIHRRIVAARDRGCAVLLNSLDLDEIKLLSDRILVMFDGAIVGEITRAEATDEALGLLMAGQREVTP